MAFTVKFYNFNKRKNSTKRPDTNTAGEEFSVLLKHPTSYRTPVLLLQKAGGFQYNYMEWAGWYYFVEDVISTGNDRFEIPCSLDVLATLRTEILASTAFVLYDGTANSQIPDTRLSTKTTRGIHYSRAEFTYIGQVSDPANAPVIMSIVGQDGVSYWALSPEQAAGMLDDINTDHVPDLFPRLVDAETLEEWIGCIADYLREFFMAFLSSGKAATCITSAVQVPCSSGGFHGNSGSVYLGNLPTGITALEIDRRICYDTMTLPLHWTFSDWRRRAPYTEMYLYCPFFGLISLPVENLIGESSITVECSLDVATGNAIFIVFGTNTQYHIGSYSSNLGGSYTVGGVSVTPMTAGTSMIGATVAGAAIIATGGSAAAMASKLGASAIAGIIGGNTPSVSTVSGGGGGAALGLRKESYIIEITHDTTVSPDSVTASIGTPTMEQKQLGGLSGFVQTRVASVSGPYYGGILDECNSLLDGGVFIE